MADDRLKPLWDMSLDEMEELKYDAILEALRLDETLSTLNFAVDNLTFMQPTKLLALRDNLKALQVKRDQARVTIVQKAVRDATRELTGYMAVIARQRLGVTDFETMAVEPACDPATGSITVTFNYKAKDGRTFSARTTCPK